MTIQGPPGSVGFPLTERRGNPTKTSKLVGHDRERVCIVVVTTP